MTEKQLLKKLDIPDWRHLSKDKVAVFANNFYKLDPEVAKAVLAQFPKFSETSLELVQQMQDSFKASISDVKEIDTLTLQNIQTLAEGLEGQLPNTTDELKPQYIDAIIKLASMEKDISESHKKFHTISFRNLAILGGGVLLGIATSLGVSVSLRNNNISSDETDDDTDCIDV